MIIKPHQSKPLFDKPDAYRAVLFYGPDGGLVREQSKKILSTLVKDDSDPFAITQLDADQIKEDPSRLFEALSAMSLMGEAPTVVVRDASDKLTTTVKEALEMTECQNYLILLGGDLQKKSTLRSLAEKHKQTACLACYREEGANLANTVRQRLEKEGIHYQRDTFIYLTSILGNDRGVTESELDKLILYLGDDKELTMEIVEALTNENDEKGLDDLCLAIAEGQVAKVNQLCESLFLEGNHPVMMVRAFSRYLQRIHTARGYVAKGETPDKAMLYLRPPVFFKQKDMFRRHMQSFTDAKLISLLAAMNKTELEVKRTSNPELPCLRAFTSVAYGCRK
jgi:DNA polymerase-3 subunit delta